MYDTLKLEERESELDDDTIHSLKGSELSSYLDEFLKECQGQRCKGQRDFLEEKDVFVRENFNEVSMIFTGGIQISKCDLHHLFLEEGSQSVFVKEKWGYKM